MTLGCTDVCGTATLEAEKILVENAILFGFEKKSAALIRAQRNAVLQLRESLANFNSDSVLRCAFRKHVGRSR
jgi:hypothetical protein